MVDKVKQLISFRYILWSMVWKELKAKYSGSILGLWWSVITPLLIMVAISFVFTKVVKIGIKNFSLFALAGIIPWFFFSVSISEASTSFFNKSQLLRQFTFPLEFIPISCVLANFLNYLFGLIFLLPFFIFNSRASFALFFLPLVLIFHLMFTVGLSILFSCINVFFRDLTHFLGVGLMFWFWITPIFYPLEMVPVQYRWICRKINPMTVYVELYRTILFKTQSPKIISLAVAFFIGVLIFGIAYALFIKLKSSIIKRL
jgi:ABC-2 type transport system permease protein